jgi:adenylate cyclase
MEPEAAGEVIGEKKAKTRQWQMATMGLVIGVIVVVAAIVIWKQYTPSAPQPEVISKENITASLPEKPSSTVPPSAEVVPKEKGIPPLPEKVSKPVAPPAPKVEVASKEKMAFPLPDKPSIAVLPFVNMSGDPKKDYLSDGITEEIINALSKIPTVFVIARNSTFTYKGKPVKVQQVSEEMGVQYVMEGSVQWSGDRVRITVQLIDALKGHHLFSDRYDRELKDIFALQDEITRKALVAMRVALRGEDARASEKVTKNLDAYLKLLQALEHMQVMNKNKMALARPLVEEALALDPGNASAYAALANVTILEVYVGTSKSPRESLDRAEELAKKALALDDSLFYPHAVLSLTYRFKKQFDKAIPPAERAVALSPNSAFAYFMLGAALCGSERFEEAIPYLKKSLRLSPIPIGQCLVNLAGAYRYLGRYDEAIATYKKLLQSEPDYLPAHVGLAGIYILVGRQEEARAEAAEVMRIDPQFSLERYAKTLPARQGLVDQAVENLRKAGLK